MDMISDATNVARHEAERALSRAADAQPAAKLAVHSGEFLIFRLGAEEYGIDIQRVQEIRSYEQPTRIADAPAFIKGVLNLRGVIVPIVDLRLKLGCGSAEYNALTVVVVLQVRGRVVGAVVDSVSEVLALDVDRTQAAPALNSALDASVIIGIGTVKCDPDARERTLILIDIEGLMGQADMGL